MRNNFIDAFTRLFIDIHQEGRIRFLVRLFFHGCANLNIACTKYLSEFPVLVAAFQSGCIEVFRKDVFAQHDWMNVGKFWFSFGLVLV